MIDLSTAKIIIGFAGSLVAAGWVGHGMLEQKADKEEVIVAGAKVDFIYDKMLESKFEQIALLDAKPNKTPDDIERLRYLRKEVERLRDIKQKR